MRNLLFLAHRIPFPPNKGDKIRSWHFLSHLAERYRVHVGAFVDDPFDWQYTNRIEEIAESTCFLPLSRRSGLVRALPGLLTGRPLTTGYYRDARMRRWVSDLAAEVPLDGVFAFSSPMMRYVPRPLAPAARVVADFVDVDSDKWRQYAERKSWPASLIYAREARTLLAEERRLAAKADAVTFVSEQEAALFRALAPDVADRVHAVRNAVDIHDFDPDAPLSPPFETTDPNLVFTGAMDYWANVDAVCWFAEDILPRIRERSPGCRFWVVGAHPAPEVRRLVQLPGVEVTGRVEDVRPYIRFADVSVVPIRVARGIQNKVLEAMAMARPVVTTPQALEGIDARPGRDLSVADDAAGFAQCVLDVMTGARGETMGASARRRVEAEYAWPASFARLDTLFEGERAAA